MATLQLADGRTLDLLKKAVKSEEEEAAPEMESLPLVPVPQEGVKLEDLPTAPKQMNVICAIVSYRLLGINDADICHALGCTNDQLFAVVNSDAYSRSYDRVIESFQRGERETAKDYLAANAIVAAQTIVTTMKKSKSEGNKLRAAEGVLNRVGVSEANSQMGMGQGLIIKVVRDTPTSSVEIKIGG